MFSIPEVDEGVNQYWAGIFPSFNDIGINSGLRTSDIDLLLTADTREQ